ncbi:MAG: (2Fe-2S)-binding protein [Lautropia sp.]|nr:(2Fe-2S)-binding protein [Lautropia sp.]
MVVCNCFNIRESDLAALASCGSCCLKSVRQATGLGTCCGKCIPQARAMLDAHKTEDNIIPIMPLPGQLASRTQHLELSA